MEIVNIWPFEQTQEQSWKILKNIASKKGGGGGGGGTFFPLRVGPILEAIHSFP